MLDLADVENAAEQFRAKIPRLAGDQESDGGKPRIPAVRRADSPSTDVTDPDAPGGDTPPHARPERTTRSSCGGLLAAETVVVAVEAVRVGSGNGVDHSEASEWDVRAVEIGWRRGDADIGIARSAVRCRRRRQGRC
jgi:hypothetical protein